MVFRSSGGQDHQLSGGDSELQQEVFSWHIREDHLAGISDEATRLRLQNLLIERFEASRPPAERRFAMLQAFLDEAGQIIDAGSAEWIGSQDAPAEDEDVPYRLNPLLALRTHLEWLHSVFANQPGISVSVR
jgi:hypothetical protein